MLNFGSHRARHVHGGAAMVVLATALACQRPQPAAVEQPPSQAEPSQVAADSPTAQKAEAKPEAKSSDSSGRPELAGVHYVVRSHGGDNATALPTIVAIHGLGDNPEDFARLFDGINDEFRVIALRGHDEYNGSFGEGWSWFRFRSRHPNKAELAQSIAESADRVAAALRELGTRFNLLGDKPVVTGFSQGGVLSFALAVRHPELIHAALPISGALPEPLWPPAPEEGQNVAPNSKGPMIRAYHGMDDPVVEFAPTKAAVEALRIRGYRVELSSYPEVEHSIPAIVRYDYHRQFEQIFADLRK